MKGRPPSWVSAHRLVQSEELLCQVDQFLGDVGFAAVLRLAQEHGIPAVDIGQNSGFFQDQRSGAAKSLARPS